MITYHSAGIYKLTRLDCQKAYTGQNSRILLVTYTEHIQSIRQNKDNPKSGLHNLNNKHSYQTTKQTTIKKLITQRKGKSQTLKKASTVKPLFIVFVGGLKKKQWIWENNRCGSHS
jgi:hypothetical protein